MLKLYQQEKINPAAGCLPILLQIPIFYALYKVLMVAVEMRHQPFALWIKDLSAPDPLTPVNLFGLLDFTPPALPRRSACCRSCSASRCGCSSSSTRRRWTRSQQQIFSIMPWVMMFVMAPFAAGLQLYWVTSNILTIAPAMVAVPAATDCTSRTRIRRRRDGRSRRSSRSARASCSPGRSTS